MRTFLLPAVTLFLMAGCDGGLEPTPPGFSGTVYFEAGTWPPPDSVVNLWLFVSRVYPLDSAKVYSGLASGMITVLPAGGTGSITDPTIPVASVRYVYPLAAGKYLYAGVIQRIRADFAIRSFRVVGVYADPAHPTLPKELMIPGSGIVSGIDIYVNFSQPPPQPF